MHNILFVCHNEICMLFNTLNAAAFNGRSNGIYIFNLFGNILCKCVLSLHALDCFRRTCALQSHLIRVCDLVRL